MNRHIFQIVLLTALLPLSWGAAAWQVDCSRLAEKLPGQEDVLTHNRHGGDYCAGNYLGREIWRSEVPELLRKVAESGDVTLRSPSGFSALQAACMMGDVVLAHALIDAGADVNARPPRWEEMGYPGYSPLGMLVSFEHLTSEEDRVRLAKALLEKGADPDASVYTRIWDHRFMKVPFELSGSDELRRLLLRYGNQDLGRRMKNWSIYWPSYSSELIREMLEGGVDPDSHIGEKGMNLMLVLMMRHPNDPSLTELAISKGADVRLGRRGQRYFSDYLFQLDVGIQTHPESAVEIVRLLLDAGADINALNKRGDSLRIHFGRKETPAARAVGQYLRSRGAKLHPDAT